METTPPSNTSRTVKRIAIVVPHAARLLALHGPLLRSLLERRHRILCLAPDFTTPVLDELASMGIECESTQVEHSRSKIRNEIKTINEIATHLKNWRPHIVLGYGGQSALCTAIAAGRAKVNRNISVLAGLADIVPFEIPGVTTGKRQHTRISRAAKLYRWRALRAIDALIVHNHGDQQALDRTGLLPEKLPVHVVHGCGVDLNHFSARPLPPLDEGLVFAMVADFTRRKGVDDYCKAAIKVAERAPTARFILVGSETGAADALPVGDLKTRYPTLDIRPALDDIRPILEQAHIIVQPSQYGEGLPKILLEALAIGRPVVTSNIFGCADTVDERVNGCLVPPADEDALATAMNSFLRRPDLIASMARASRAKAERLFDVKTVNQGILTILQVS